MFSKTKKITNNINELSNYIDNIDIYNSKLFYDLQDPSIDRVDYEITVYEYRPDLIAQDFYGNSSFLPFVLLFSGLGLEQLTRGTVISLVPRKTLEDIIKGV